MKYQILAQFLKPGAYFDPKAKEAVETAVEYYNSHSLITRNPKQILKHGYINNDETLEIVLESQEELPVPSKALRMLSTYLVNNTYIGEGDYLSGKQLFKMQSSQIFLNQNLKKEEPSKDERDQMSRLASYMLLLQKADPSMKADLDRIDSLIEQLLNKSGRR